MRVEREMEGLVFTVTAEEVNKVLQSKVTVQKVRE